jgi:deoxyribonuclease V
MRAGDEGTVTNEQLHAWDLTPKEAVALQRQLASQVLIEPLQELPETLAAVDVSIRGKEASAAIVVVDRETGSVIDAVRNVAPVPFPYVPGLLSFREIPSLMPVIDQLSVMPDVFMCDGQGVAHPRRFGLASHLGLWLDVPAFGVAKKKLVGEYDEPSIEAGATTSLYDGDEIIGAVVRTRTGVKPVFVSAGHRIDLTGAVDLTFAHTSRFRLPDPARMAHRLSKDGIMPDRL